MSKSAKKTERNKMVKAQKREARDKLKAIKPFKLKRDLFLVHGWGDEYNVCWTYPYTEQGKARSKGWKYTFKEWAEEKIINHKERVHYLKLVRDESKVKPVIKHGNIEKVVLGKKGNFDETFFYLSFFEFAELLKDKVNKKRQTRKIDVLSHSMGGLDTVTAIAINPGDDATDCIEKPVLRGVQNLITVYNTPVNSDHWLRCKMW